MSLNSFKDAQQADERAALFAREREVRTSSMSRRHSDARKRPSPIIYSPLYFSDPADYEETPTGDELGPGQATQESTGGFSVFIQTMCLFIAFVSGICIVLQTALSVVLADGTLRARMRVCVCVCVCAARSALLFPCLPVHFIKSVLINHTVCVCMYVRMYVCMYVCMYVFMYVCVYMCM
jgi:hypothetical protein